jgi:hypothetical protein
MASPEIITARNSEETQKAAPVDDEIQETFIIEIRTKAA